LICFRSNKRRVRAAKLLGSLGTLPVLFRQQEDSDAALSCRFVAELVEIQFAHTFSTNSKRLAWLDEKLWLHWEVVKGSGRDKKYPTWEAQYKAWEIDKFMVAKT
jgi:hypothetical protein